MSWWGKSSSNSPSTSEKEGEFKAEKVISVGKTDEQSKATSGTTPTTTTTEIKSKEPPPLPSLGVDPQVEKYMNSCVAKAVMSFFAGEFP